MSLIDVAQEIGLDFKKVSGTDGGEYHGPCPACGGIDRFIMHPNKKKNKCDGAYWCRQCGIHGDSIQFCREFHGMSFEDSAKHVNANIEKNATVFRPKKEVLFMPIELINPSDKWSLRADLFVLVAQQEIHKNPEAKSWLNQRGISEEAVNKYRLGWNPEETFQDRDDWGLEYEETEDGKFRQVWISEGLVVPIIDRNSGKVIRIKIRRARWVDGDVWPKYVAVSGSMNGLSIIGDTNKDIMVVVESELDALAIDHAVGDKVFVVGIGSNIKNPDYVTDFLAKQKPILLICYDNDEAGTKMLAKWKKLYLHAFGYPTPIGKDIGEAIERGLDIRNWILEGADKVIIKTREKFNVA